MLTVSVRRALRCHCTRADDDVQACLDADSGEGDDCSIRSGEDGGCGGCGGCDCGGPEIEEVAHEANTKGDGENGGGCRSAEGLARHPFLRRAPRPSRRANSMRQRRRKRDACSRRR